ncbi:MAG: hypothetical protein JXA93_10120 [Anaerolineae bacterium]|nr:hypothetical protein [Anaerolineae bacterium]
MKKVSVLIALVLVVGLAASAMASGPRTTGFQVQNLSATADADVTIFYYRTDGTIECTDTATIPTGGSQSWYQGDAAAGGNSCISTLSGSWIGSVVIESTEPVAVIANIAESGDYAAGAYVGSGQAQIGMPLILPAIMDGGGFHGFTTDFAIQNAGGGTATCDIEFWGEVSGAVDKTIPGVSIEAGASYYRDQELDGDNLPGDNWLGVVVADCNQPMAGTINQKPLADAAGALLTYDAVAVDKIPATGDVLLPVIMWDFFNYWTGVQVVATQANTSGVIHVYDDTGAEVDTEPFGPLGQYGSFTLLPNWTGGTFVGAVDELYSAVVEFTAGGGTAMVNQRDKPGVVGMTYSGLFEANATINLSIPFAANNYYGVSTGFQVVNTGAAGDITVYFEGTPGTGSVDTQVGPINLATGAALPLQQFQTGGNDPVLSGCTTCGSYPPFLNAEHWTGSIRVEGDAGMMLSAIVNERGYSQTAAGIVGDVGQVYNAFNY